MMACEEGVKQHLLASRLAVLFKNSDTRTALVHSLKSGVPLSAGNVFVPKSVQLEVGHNFHDCEGPGIPTEGSVITSGTQ